MPQPAPPTIENLIDDDSFTPSGDTGAGSDPLGFPGYAGALQTARDRSGSSESVVTGSATIRGVPVEIASFDFSFLGGSMGSAAGEVLALALERSAARGTPFVLRTATGGARMQEGMASLVQLPKVVSARLGLAGAGLPFLAVLGHPTTGGVLASLAALADVTIAEAGATIGFAGPRVVESASGRALSADSHTAASALAAGLVDAVVEPGEVGAALATALSILTSKPEPSGEPPPATPSSERAPWKSLQKVRAPDWPRGPDLARAVGGAFFELRGDRAGGDDPACVAGLTTIGGRPALVLALDRRLSPGPRAYRKAIRCLRIGTRLSLPVVTFVDTPGADPSEASEAGGIAWAIAGLFEAMLSAPVPVVSVLTGEGGSGGALAFAAGDVLLAYEDAVFEVIAPELAATILWRDAGRAAEAAGLLGIDSVSLTALGICDGVLPGRPDPESLGPVLAYHLGRLADGSAIGNRNDRWRNSLG